MHIQLSSHVPAPLDKLYGSWEFTESINIMNVLDRDALIDKMLRIMITYLAGDVEDVCNAHLKQVLLMCCFRSGSNVEPWKYLRHFISAFADTEGQLSCEPAQLYPSENKSRHNLARDAKTCARSGRLVPSP